MVANWLLVFGFVAAIIAFLFGAASEERTIAITVFVVAWLVALSGLVVRFFDFEVGSPAAESGLKICAVGLLTAGTFASALFLFRDNAILTALVYLGMIVFAVGIIRMWIGLLR